MRLDAIDPLVQIQDVCLVETLDYIVELPKRLHRVVLVTTDMAKPTLEVLQSRLNALLGLGQQLLTFP